MFSLPLDSYRLENQPNVAVDEVAALCNKTTQGWAFEDQDPDDSRIELLVTKVYVFDSLLDLTFSPFRRFVQL